MAPLASLLLALIFIFAWEEACISVAAQFTWGSAVANSPAVIVELENDFGQELTIVSIDNLAERLVVLLGAGVGAGGCKYIGVRAFLAPLQCLPSASGAGFVRDLDLRGAQLAVAVSDSQAAELVVAEAATLRGGSRSWRLPLLGIAGRVPLPPTRARSHGLLVRRGRDVLLVGGNLSDQVEMLVELGGEKSEWRVTHTIPQAVLAYLCDATRWRVTPLINGSLIIAGGCASGSKQLAAILTLVDATGTARLDRIVEFGGSTLPDPKAAVTAAMPIGDNVAASFLQDAKAKTNNLTFVPWGLELGGGGASVTVTMMPFTPGNLPPATTALTPIMGAKSGPDLLLAFGWRDNSGDAQVSIVKVPRVVPGAATADARGNAGDGSIAITASLEQMPVGIPTWIALRGSADCAHPLTAVPGVASAVRVHLNASGRADSPVLLGVVMTRHLERLRATGYLCAARAPCVSLPSPAPPPLPSDADFYRAVFPSWRCVLLEQYVPVTVFDPAGASLAPLSWRRLAAPPLQFAINTTTLTHSASPSPSHAATPSRPRSLTATPTMTLTSTFTAPRTATVLATATSTTHLTKSETLSTSFRGSATLTAPAPSRTPSRSLSQTSSQTSSHTPQRIATSTLTTTLSATPQLTPRRRTPTLSLTPHTPSPTPAPSPTAGPTGAPLTPAPRSHASGAHSDLVTGAAVTGGVIGLVVLAALAAFLARRRRLRRSRRNSDRADSLLAPGEYTTLMDGKKYALDRVLGKGGYGVVFLATRNSDRRKVAFKYITCRSDHDRQLAIREFELIKRVRDHPNMIKILDFILNWQEVVDYGAAGRTAGIHGDASPLQHGDSALTAMTRPRYVAIVTPFYEEGDMRRLILGLKRRGSAMEERRIVALALQVAQLLEHFHAMSPALIHRDIKPENILLDRKGWHAVVTDFGLATIFDSGAASHMSTRAGSLPYCAPEVFAKYYTESVDVWSLGCVMYAMCTLRVTVEDARIMFNDVDEPGFAEVIHHDIVAERNYRPQMAQLILLTLTADYKHRISAAQLVLALREYLAQHCHLSAVELQAAGLGCAAPPPGSESSSPIQ